MAAQLDAAAQAAIAAMIQQQVAQQVAAARQQWEQQAGAVVDLRPPPPAYPRPQGPKLDAPPKFDGKADALDTWLGAMDRQFDWYAFATPAGDADRLRLAASALDRDAWEWYSHLAARPSTWIAFVDALRMRFQPVTAAETARAKLSKLSQGKQSTNEYIAAFRRLLASVPTMGEDDRLFAFTRGLRPSIATHLRIHNVKTIDAAVDLAARVGSAGELQHVASAASTGASSSPMELDALLAGIEGLEPESSTDGPSSSTSTRSQLAELLAALREQRKGGFGKPSTAGPRPLPRISHLTPEQVKSYMADGKCFGCGAKDHGSRHCPRRVIGADKRVSWPQPSAN